MGGSPSGHVSKTFVQLNHSDQSTLPSLANMQTSIMASQLGSSLRLGGTRINRPASSGPSSRVSAPIQAIFTRNKDKQGKASSCLPAAEF